MNQDAISPEVIRDLYGVRIQQLRERWLASGGAWLCFVAGALIAGLSSNFRSQWHALFPLAFFLLLAARERKAWTQIKGLTPQEAFRSKLL